MIQKTVNKLSLVFFILCFAQIYGQQKEYKGDPDVTFETARKLAFNNQRKQAQDTLLFILTKYPDYHDVRSFLATTYSWDEEYKKAKKEFEYILKKEETNKSAWLGIIQNELWASSPYIAIELSEKALKYYPNDAEILLLRASAEEKTNNQIEANKTVLLVLSQDSNNQKAIDFKNALNKKLNLNNIGVSAATDLYSDIYNPAQYYSIKYGRETKYGSITAKINFNRRFEENGVQYEVDLYPKITKGLYGYLNAGYSNSSLFPESKYGAELFKSLPKGFEVSLGFRSLIYDTTTNIFTGSVTWYTGNSYWSLRSYVTPSDTGTSLSGALTYRLYRKDADNYFSAAIGAGYSPEVNQFSNNGDQVAIFNLKSQKLNVGYNFTTLNNKNAIGLQSGITHQELLFDPSNYVMIYFLSVSWELRFK
ncbi:YaiO family outer membrane beta-barrel protein [Flavobacterium granuli]|uniref:YaiO family outer membrane protein n=1 Tax=Flavobacterium granuli TaxID=280093 RepID=A0ABU1RYX8_9FLAO|nr:YaiO family outer membrane beta-barrel protein [Flavobacterium granuli]MDR6843570.1 YaiO family outer membrane protein [Flavobacterium granuli]